MKAEKIEITLRVVKNKPLNFCGRMLEVGTIYGWDARSEFYCNNYRVLDVTVRDNYPILEMHRYNAHTDRFTFSEEGNRTTEKICDFYAEHEEACAIPDTPIARGWNPMLKGKRIDMKINPSTDTVFHDRRLPAGVIFGHDGKSAFFVKSFNNVKFRNGYPILWVYRAYDDDGRRVKNQSKWAKEPVRECSPISQAIYKMYMANRDICVVKYWDSAYEMAAHQELRQGWEEPLQSLGYRMKNRMNPVKSTRIEIVVNEARTLEDMSRKQGGNLWEQRYRPDVPHGFSVYDADYVDTY